MKKSVKASLFPRKSGGVLAGCLPVRLRVSYKGKRIDLRAGCSVEPSKWDAASERVLPNAKNRYRQSASELNKIIEGCREKIDDIFARFELVEKRVPSTDELKKAFDAAMGRQKGDNAIPPFYAAFDEFTATMGRQNGWTKETYTKFNSIREHLSHFSPSLEFKDINEGALQGFVESMHSEDLRNTTIAKNISFLKWFLRWAHRRGYNPSTAQDTFRPKLKGTDGNSKEVIYLEWEELMSLYGFAFPAGCPSLPQVRDVFCFCCFTGLRYSDVAKLKKSDIKGNSISVVTQKTADGLIIELNKYSRAILGKYGDADLPKGKALPVISNAKMNERLKVMGKAAGLDAPQRIVYFKGSQRYEEVHPKYELLTTHCGRRTFIVNSLRLGIPSEVIMKWTGHSDFKAMKPYVKIVDKLKESEMSKFDDFKE